ncbi:hypothetical protein AB0N16_09445 [Streptomyces sp. NPDC051105]|uniref:hypothetical protein n=1 Tax=Streptomyces sp. NPDC051105 TaxID=3154843 RepID=UPI00343E946E
MDLQSTVTAIPRATPIDGLDRAWTWRLHPVLNFAGALTADGTRPLGILIAPCSTPSVSARSVPRPLPPGSA